MSFTKKLMSALVASSLVLGTVSTAFAAPSAEDVNAAFARLNHYNIVQGIPGENGQVTPGLEAPITRAQLLTILVRAWGQEANAKLLAGAATGFTDVDNAGVDWATGYIFIGNRIAETNGGQKLGTSATTFNPNGGLTAVETLAFVMKFLGLPVGTGANWAADTIKMAKDAGLITDADEAKFLADPNAVVNRGQAFSLLDTMFAGYNKMPGGKTVYTTYVDTAAPELTVNKPELTTDKAALTVTGSVKGDYTAVYLGSEKLTVNEDGTFSVDVNLNVGANNLVFTAMDMVGNTDEESFTVTRNPGVAAKITATMPAEVVAGETVDVAVTVTDANGVALEVAAADITVTAGGSVGTYADGKFTAAEKVGTGTLTFSYGDLTPATVDVKVVAGPLAQVIPSAKSVAKGETVTLTPADKFGNPVSSGVTYTWEGTGIAVTSGGVVYTSDSGVYKITAKAGEATAEVSLGVYGDIAKLKVDLPETIVANGETRKAVTVTALDEFDNVISGYTDDDVSVNLKSSGVLFFKDDKDTTAAETDDDIDLNFENGVATAYFAVPRALAGEELTFSAAYTPDGGDEISVEATTDAVLAVAAALKIDSIPKFFPANASGTKNVAVIVVDQEGVPVEDAYDITATATGPAVLDDDTQTYNGLDSDGDPVAAVFTLDNSKSVGVEGTITVTFTAEGVGSVTGEIKHVVAGNPAKLGVTSDVDSKSADGEIVFTVQVQDRNGVPVFTGDDDPAFKVELSGGKASNFDVTDHPTDDNTAPVSYWDVDDKAAVFDTFGTDVQSFKFRLKTMEKFTGDVTAKVTIKTGSYGTLTGSKTVSFVPGAVSQIVLSKEEVWAPVSNPTATVVASLADAKGNTVAKSGVELAAFVDDTTVTVNGTKTTAEKPLKIKTDANGQVSLELKARPYADRDYDLTVETTDDEDDIDPEVATFSIKETVVASIATKLYRAVVDAQGNTKYISTTSAKAGEPLYVVATVKDNYGGEYDFGADLDTQLIGFAKEEVLDAQYGGGEIVLTDEFTFGLPTDYDALARQLKIITTDELGNDEVAPGVYIAEVIPAKSGVTSIGAKVTLAQTDVEKTSSLSISAGELAKVVVNGGDPIEVTDTGKVYGPYTIALADVYDNTVTLKSNKTIEFLTTSDVSFRRTEGGATTDTFSTRSTATFYFVALTEGTHTIDVTVDGEDFGSFDIEVVPED